VWNHDQNVRLKLFEWAFLEADISSTCTALIGRGIGETSLYEYVSFSILRGGVVIAPQYMVGCSLLA